MRPSFPPGTVFRPGDIVAADDGNLWTLKTPGFTQYNWVRVPLPPEKETHVHGT